MMWAYLAVHDLGCIVAAVYLIHADHPWWAFAFFVSLVTTTTRSSKD